MRKNIYKWHRTLSLIIALPVLLWASSGFMHPIMTNIRPAVASQVYTSPVIDTSQLIVPLQKCLQQNHIDSFSNIRIVQMGGQQFYQVILDNQHQDIRYISTRSGSQLRNGDDLYARFLAKHFLEGSEKKGGTEETPEEPMAMSDHDCCMMATMNIMNSKGAWITGVEKVNGFTDEYKYINRLLPVYKVSFYRGDGIRIYVETAGSRFGFAMDNKRAIFDRLFGLFHTWEWMNGLGNTKYFIMVLITLTGFLTTLMGLYIFFTTKTRKSTNPLIKSRRNHRYTSLAASLFTLLFTFSGGFHALDKLLPKGPFQDQPLSLFATSGIHFDFKKIDSAVGYLSLQGLSVCRMDTQVYWQVFPKPEKSRQDSRTDLMKNTPVAEMLVLYLNASDYSILPLGEEQYAKTLSTLFSGNPSSEIKSVEWVPKFTDEYNFISKRLPVWKVSYAVHDNERYYVETSTGALSLRVRDKDLVEGYSFALFHKHHFMDWGGKSVRDFSTMFWAAMQVAMVIVGLLLWLKYRRRRTTRFNKRSEL